MSGEISICPLCHTENAEEEGECVVLGGARIIQRARLPPRQPLLCHRISRRRPEAADPSSQRQDSSELMSTLPGQALGKWHAKGKYVPGVWSHHQRQGRNHGNQQGDPEETGDRRGEATFQPDGGGTHRTGSGARRGRRTQEVAGRGPFGGTSSPEQSDRSSIPSGTCDGRNVPDHETGGGELGASRSMKTGQKKRLLGGIKKTETMWERWYEAINEEEEDRMTHRKQLRSQECSID